MTRAISHFVETVDTKFADIYYRYLDYYEENKRMLAYKLAFVTHNPLNKALVLTFEIPPGKYPVMLYEKVYNIAQPWQYLSMTFRAVGGGRWEADATCMAYTTRQCVNTANTKSYLPPLLPNYQHYAYCIGWTHDVYQSSDIDHMIQAVNSLFANHFGLAINMDLYTFNSEWLWYKMCHDFMNPKDYIYWTDRPSARVSSWETRRINRYPEVLALMEEKLTVDWFLKDCQPYKLYKNFSVIDPLLDSPYTENGGWDTTDQQIADRADLMRSLVERKRPWMKDQEYRIRQSGNPYLVGLTPAQRGTKRYHKVFPKTWDIYSRHANVKVAVA